MDQNSNYIRKGYKSTKTAQVGKKSRNDREASRFIKYGAKELETQAWIAAFWYKYFSSFTLQDGCLRFPSTGNP
jgi:hypothetical protein